MMRLRCLKGGRRCGKMKGGRLDAGWTLHLCPTRRSRHRNLLHAWTDILVFRHPWQSIKLCCHSPVAGRCRLLPVVASRGSSVGDQPDESWQEPFGYILCAGTPI